MEKSYLQLQKEKQEHEDRVTAILDKIESKMKEFKAVAPATAKRVILELLQNAKDAAKPDGVHVKINVSNDQLVFRHDGECFQIKHVKGLVDRISSKNRDGDVDLNDRKTGRFGTGFICTHLLGEDVLVKGVVMLEIDDQGTKQFKEFEIPLSDFSGLAFSCNKEIEFYRGENLYFFYPEKDKVQVAEWAMFIDLMAERRSGL